MGYLLMNLGKSSLVKLDKSVNLFSLKYLALSA